jgi:alkylhydroperoxidase family enzyme
MSEFWKKMWTAMNDVAGEAVVLEVMANHPAVHEFYVKQFYNKFFHNKDGDMSVEIRLKELLRLRLAVEHGCHVCNSSNFISARAHGFTDEQVRGVGDPTPGLFDERELAIIDFASMMTLHNVQGQLTPELYARLREYFSDADIIELGFLAAVFTGTQKLYFALDLVSRWDSCPVKHPEPATGSPAGP